jgi:hypothetical protein
VPDAVCDCFRDLGAYDFRPAHEVNVDIGAGTAGALVDVDLDILAPFPCKSVRCQATEICFSANVLFHERNGARTRFGRLFRLGVN